MNISSVYRIFLRCFFLLGMVFGASASQAALVPATTGVIYKGIAADNTHRFEVNWSMINVPDRQLSNGVWNFGIGFRDTGSSDMFVNMSNSAVGGTPFPKLYLSGTGDFAPCIDRTQGNTYTLSCIGDIWVRRNGSSGTANFYIFVPSTLGQNVNRVQLCTSAQQTEVGPAAAVGILPETCYTGLPTVVDATCSIDTPQLLLDHGALNPNEVNGNVQELDLDISCTPKVTARVYTAGGNVVFFGNGSISSTITIDGQNPRRADIDGSRSFKLRSTLSSSSSPAAGSYSNNTTLMINIE